MFDLIQALGSVLDMKWVNEGKVYTGPYCTAQGTKTSSHAETLVLTSDDLGVIQELGECGVAISTTVRGSQHSYAFIFYSRARHH